MFTAIGLAGCGNFCVSGFYNNGNNSNNGAIIVRLNPSSVCSLTKANGTVRAVALKSAVCETCTAAARVEHVFVTVRDIQLRVGPTKQDEQIGYHPDVGVRFCNRLLATASLFRQRLSE
jgi:hypothetical protein